MALSRLYPVSDGIFSAWLATPAGAHWSTVDDPPESWTDPFGTGIWVDTLIAFLDKQREEHVYATLPGDLSSAQELKVLVAFLGSGTDCNVTFRIFKDGVEKDMRSFNLNTNNVPAGGFSTVDCSAWGITKTSVLKLRMTAKFEVSGDPPIPNLS